MTSQQQLLEQAESYLRAEVAPKAEAIDRDMLALYQALLGLGDRALLALKVTHNSSSSQETIAHRFKEMVARYSGALAFLQTQHQSASAMLASSKNRGLKQEYLDRLATGDRLLGIAFSQLRRSGEPMVKAWPVNGGYQIDGQVPWVTGFGIFEEFILGAQLPDGRAVYGIVPFSESYQEGDRASNSSWKLGRILFTPPMSLAAMQSSQTVSAQLESWFLTQDRIVVIRPPGWIHEQDQKNVLNASFFALGCTRAALDIIEAAIHQKQLTFIRQAFEIFDRELRQCRSAIFKAIDKRESSELNAWYTQALELRAWAIELANRCAHAAVTVSSGAANSNHHAAGRVYREALVFTVSGQTTAVMEQTLQRLTRSRYYR
ncbi:acyl-CoA dehydrogenase [Oxynema aestuarii]|jgi:alkylation response protein AidB-like acyl-CoA dehydrogenase|uniref:Acyl-CoA dehydrogenase n=1 Tax=Oxynema aestuarii AP17 TaxID=2064643 RepID=A0A6H1TSY6_9CYAN|nr:acyl-CoA dehydrogenase [Oxynema aestuarii]QIZ69555.1 acyl-CoA dehydrogenase [Oxynema aestuarii AP17]RMH73636.1 MAG: acyl-CoA dehydrogenase [Cyanobacteria bacterium J007]